jgi:dsRNA-specific ribonuclease
MEEVTTTTYNFLNPYNSLNKEITLNDVQCILKKYGVHYEIFNFNLFKRAFIHSSYTKKTQYELSENNLSLVECPKDCIPLHSKSNERLEFLGDGVLELVTKYYLYRRFPKENEGFMTEKKIAIIKNEAIGKIAQEMGLHKWFILSRQAEEKNIRNNLKKLGCLFEAFMGALFLDVNKISIKDEEGWFGNIFHCGPGFQMAQTFIEHIFEQHIDWVALIQNDDNYKNILQVKIQKEFKVTPCYVELENDYENGYKMGVFLCIGQSIHNIPLNQYMHIDDLSTFQQIHDYIKINGKILLFMGSSQHKIKKKAEQIACNEVLTKLNIN